MIESELKILTIKQLLEQNAEKFSNEIAFQMRKDGNYRKFTYQEVKNVVNRLQCQLLKMGVGIGDRVALISENRPEWPIAYLAITAMGAVVVPLDAMLKVGEVLPLLEDSEPKAIILSDHYLEYIKGMPLQDKAIFMEEFHCLPTSGVLPEIFIDLDHLAAIVYTSGTTGTPKGVMLSHRNIVMDAIVSASLFGVGPGDVFLSVLPLHHTFETTGGFFVPFSSGCCITYAESLKSHAILQNMQDTGVTHMLGVPLLFQLFYEGILRQVEDKGLKKIFSFLFGLSSFFRNIIGVNIGRLLFSTVHKQFGGKIKFFASGGAALDPQTIKNFDLMGFDIYQGYGLTESAPVLNVNYPGKNRIGSVGRPILGVEIKITGNGPIGEILASGPNLMLGYYKRKDLTDEVIINGWLHTGDEGYLDEDGYLYITGRAKDIIVTGSGVNVYPEELEFLLKKIPAIKESCVLGDKVKEGVRKGNEEVLAVIVPNLEYLEKQGKTDDAAIHTAIEREVSALNKKVAHFKRIEKFIIRKEDLPKTRLQKVKRFELRKELGL